MRDGMFPFTYFCHKVLPASFDDSLSYYEVLCKLTDKVNELLSSSDSKFDELERALNELYEYVHGTPWQDEIDRWVVCNLPEIIAKTCRWFHFGIDDDGYIVCTIPFSWSRFEITWDMGYGSADFGKLTIGW